MKVIWYNVYFPLRHSIFCLKNNDASVCCVNLWLKTIFKRVRCRFSKFPHEISGCKTLVAVCTDIYSGKF